MRLGPCGPTLAALCPFRRPSRFDTLLERHSPITRAIQLKTEGIRLIRDGGAATARRRTDNAFQWLELDDLVNAVTDLVRRHLPPESAAVLDDPDADLTSAGFESLTLVALLVDLEAQFAITFPADQLDVGTFRSVNTITAALRASAIGILTENGRDSRIRRRT